MGHSDNRITENEPPSIGKGTANLGVGSSEPTRQRVRRGDRPLQTPRLAVPSSIIPLGVESQEPVSPVAQASPKAEPHSDRREASHYPEPLAISHTTSTTDDWETDDWETEDWESDNKSEKGINLEVPCPGVALHGECEEGHRWAKGVICNREWCPPAEDQCGGKNGPAHNRRKARWMPKARQIGGMGRFIITTPLEIRYKYRTQESLGKVGTAFKRMFQRHGYDRGLRRWHLFGEDHREEGQGTPQYHPHLEVLVDGSYLRRKQLRAIKRSVANILGVRVSRVNVYYEYVRPGNIRRKLHRVSYALRPTFTDWRWDVSLAYSIIGFHNMQTWGKWDGPDLWDVPEGDSEAPGADLEALEKGYCPLDGSRITWSGVRPVSQLVGPYWKPVGGGYWLFQGEPRASPG